MFKELVTKFRRRPIVYAAEYLDGFRTSTNILYRPRMQMEVTGLSDGPYYMLITPDGIYLDREMKQRMPDEDSKYWTLLRLRDPRVIVRGLIPSSENEEISNSWRAEYDVNRLQLDLPKEIFEGKGPKIEFGFDEWNGQLRRLIHVESGHSGSLSFYYSRSEWEMSEL